MTNKTSPIPAGTATPPAGSTQHHDSVLESIGKAITDAVWESSGEADQSGKGAERRAATERAARDDPQER